MPKLTINEAVELTGKSKRTIQRYISTGKLSYTVKKDGTRMLDEGEIIANFGRVIPTVTPTLSQPVTPSNQAEQLAELMQGLQQAIIEAQAPLLAQIAALTNRVEELTNRLEYKPKPVVQEVEPEAVTETVEDYSDIPPFLWDEDPENVEVEETPRPKKQKPDLRVATNNGATTDLSGESSYMKIPVFGKD